MENVVLKVMENRENQLKKQQNGNWGTGTRNNLVKLLEENGVYISDFMWDLLLFNIHNLTIDNDKLSYSCLGKPSKRVTNLLIKHKELIINNKDRIFYGGTY